MMTPMIVPGYYSYDCSTIVLIAFFPQLIKCLNYYLPILFNTSILTPLSYEHYTGATRTSRYPHQALHLKESDDTTR